MIATLAGVGRIGLAPGTVASAVALVPAWLLVHYTGTVFLLVAIFTSIVIGTWASDAYAREAGNADPSECVVDELAGQWVACALVPPSVLAFALVFLAFRLFDIVKPWPVSAVERLPGGVGIMADDLAAGFFAGLLVAVIGAMGLV